MHFILLKRVLERVMTINQSERVCKQQINAELLQHKYYCQDFSLTGRVFSLRYSHCSTDELDWVYLPFLPVVLQNDPK